MCDDNRDSRDYMTKVTQDLWNSVDTWTIVLRVYKRLNDYQRHNWNKNIDILMGESTEKDRYWATDEIIGDIMRDLPQ